MQMIEDWEIEEELSKLRIKIQEKWAGHETAAEEEKAVEWLEGLLEKDEIIDDPYGKEVVGYA